MIKIVFKKPAANGAEFITTTSATIDDIAPHLESGKFLWIDETALIAIDNISHIVKVS